MRARTVLHPRVYPKGSGGSFPQTAGDIVLAEQVDERLIRLSTPKGWLGYSPSRAKVDGLRQTFAWDLQWVTDGKV